MATTTTAAALRLLSSSSFPTRTRSASLLLSQSWPSSYNSTPARSWFNRNPSPLSIHHTCHLRQIHSTCSTQQARRAPTSGSLAGAKRFGQYSPLAPFSLRLGVQPPNVKALIPDHILRPRYAMSGEGSFMNDQIPINTPEDIAGIRKAGQLAKRILALGGKLAKPGVTTLAIDEFLRKAIVDANAYPSPLNYMGFPNSICTSISNVIAHGIPDSRPLQDGDIINIDITVYLEGYHGDTSATFLVGNVDQRGRDLVQHTLDSLNEAIAICGPKVPLTEIGRTIQKVADRHGYSICQQLSGHGIGKEFHCMPLIYHHENKEEGIMEPGMVFTIEPMFCQGSGHGVQWPDRWTIVTADGGRSAQWEHTVLITDDGAERLT